MNIKKIGLGVCALSVTALVLSGCSNDDSDNNSTTTSPTMTTSAASSSASSAASAAGNAVDKAKSAAFVAAFRTGYGDLSTDRDDDSIEKIVTDTCALREKGAGDDEQKAAVKALATNGTTVPTDEQASHILDMVVPACP